MMPQNSYSKVEVALRLHKLRSLIESMEVIQDKAQREVLVMDWLLEAWPEV